MFRVLRHRWVSLGALTVATSAACPTALARTDALPTATGYQDTCAAVSSWCMNDTVSGSVPSDLVRPLALPTVVPGRRCPVTKGSRVDSPYFGGIALGSGDVRPIIGAVGGNIRGGILWMYHPHGYPGWWSVKTLWYAAPTYTGPILIRGRRLDGAGKIAFGEVPSVFAPQLSPDATLNGGNGWREYPGGTFVRHLGCYGFQIDGSSFSTIIVFKATRSRA